jgi:hypothetical protein
MPQHILVILCWRISVVHPKQERRFSKRSRIEEGEEGGEGEANG